MQLFLTWWHVGPSFHCTTISLHFSNRQLLSFFPEALATYNEGFLSPTNNCNYTLSLLKCDKPDSIFFLLNSLRWQPLPSFSLCHLLVLWPARTSADRRQSQQRRSYSLASREGCFACLPLLVRDLGGKCVSLSELLLKVASPRRDQKPPPPPPVTSCGILQPGCINLSRSSAHFLSGWQVDMLGGYFASIPPMNAARRLSLGPRLHRGRREITPLFSVTFIFVCASSDRSFMSLFFSLSLSPFPGNYHRPWQEPCLLEGEKSGALPLKFLIV